MHDKRVEVVVSRSRDVSTLKRRPPQRLVVVEAFALSSMEVEAFLP